MNSLHASFYINCPLFLFSYDFISRWMEINAKCSIKYALDAKPTSPCRRWSFLVSPRPCLLPQVRALQSYRGVLPFSSASWGLTLCTVLQCDFDVTCLENDVVPFNEMRFTLSRSMFVDFSKHWSSFQSVTVRENISAWEWKGLCHIDWSQRKMSYLSASEFERGENFSAWLLLHSTVRSGQIPSKRSHITGKNQWRTPVTAQ